MSISRNVLLYVIYFIVVVAMVVGVIMAFTYHAPKKPVAKAPTSSQAVQNNGSSNGSNSHSGSSATNSGNPSQSGNSAPKSPANSATTSPSSNAAASASTQAALNNGSGTSNQKLANSGPGSTFGIFIVASVLGALAFRRYQLSQLS